MNKFIRIFSYILMVLGAVILLGGLGTGIAGLFVRSIREVGRELPMARLALSGIGFANGLRLMLTGLLVSGFGMLLHQVTELVRIKYPLPVEIPAKTSRAK